MVTQQAAERRPTEAAPVVVEAVGITKSFGGVPVLKGVDLVLRRGEVTALAGENGAGKSTLIKIIAGQVRPDEGQVDIEGGLRPTSIRAAHAAGVAIVPQELAPVLDLTVYENVFLGRELRTAIGTLDRRRMRAEARRMLAEFDVDIDVTARMRTLSVALQQIVEIVKNTGSGAKVLLLDEPTSAISEREIDRLYAVVNRLRERGVSMIYTTHKMAEMRALADRVVVLRDGMVTRDDRMTEISDDEIVNAMIGRELGQLFPARSTPRTEPVLRVRDVQVRRGDPAVSLDVHPGEVVALAGLVGAGRTELLESLVGARPRAAGSVEVDGSPVRRGNVRAAIAAGMAIVPEDRKVGGLVLSQSVEDNLALPHLRAFSSASWLRRGRVRRSADEVMRTVGLRSAVKNPLVGHLSGGNQQKVVLGKWLAGEVKVLLLDEPTRGVDVGARGELYRVIADLARDGLAVLMASSDMTEVLGLAHRVLVVREFGVVGELGTAEIQAPDAQDRIFRLASGLNARSDS